jgi:hypothetical protein
MYEGSFDRRKNIFSPRAHAIQLRQVCQLVVNRKLTDCRKACGFRRGGALWYVFWFALMQGTMRDCGAQLQVVFPRRIWGHEEFLQRVGGSC